MNKTETKWYMTVQGITVVTLTAVMIMNWLMGFEITVLIWLAMIWSNMLIRNWKIEE
jgi:hypothetical protein